MTIPVIRVRTKTPKVRTGCRTCKARRVRCDEGKPTCHRCAKAGRECAGYEANVSLPNDRHDGKILKPSVYQSQDCLGTPTACLVTLPIALKGVQRQALHYFHTQVAHQLSGHFSADLHQLLLPQLSHQHEAVLHACLAVTLAHRAHRLQSQSSSHLGSVSLSHQGLHERQTLQQYVRTVTSLRNLIDCSHHHIETSKVEIVLLVCLLCVHFSLLRGSEDEAFAHLEKGLAVVFGLSRPYASTRGTRFRPLTISTTPTKPLEILLREFVRLDGEFASYASRKPYLSPELDPDLLGKGEATRMTFASLAEAKIILDTLSSSVTRHHGALLRYTTTHIDDLGLTFKDEAHRDAHIRAFSRGVKHALLTHAQERTSKALSAWSSALEALAHNESEGRGYLTLRLQFFSTWFLNSTYNDTHECLTDKFESTFGQVVDLAEKYLLYHSARGQEAASFGPSPAALPALFTVGMKCRTSSIRRKAIALLRDTILQEGLWLGPPLAVLAEQVADVEEMLAIKLSESLLDGGSGGLKCSEGPEAARVSDVVVVLDDEVHRRGRLVWARTDHDCDGGGVVVTEEYPYGVKYGFAVHLDQYDR